MHFRSLLYWVSVLLATPLPASGAQYFVSPSGSPQGDGTMAKPWDLPGTLKTPSAVIRPGDTIYLLEGTYVAPSQRYFQSYLTGAPNQFITVRPYGQNRVTVIGGFHVRGAWSIFRDLDVTNTYTDRTSSQTGSDPTDVNTVHCFVVYAPNVKLINNVMHDNGLGMASWSEAPDTELYGNIVYYNGWQAPDRAHGHGLYAQNQTGSKRIIDNIVFDQFARGFQIYGSNQAFLDAFYLEGNILFNNGSLGNTGYDRNILIGGGNTAKNPILKDNHSYFPSGAAAGDVNLGYWPDGEGCSGLQFNNNYIASGGRNLIIYNCTVSSMTGNTIYGATTQFDPTQYPNNTYINTADRPSGVNAFVRPNQYEPGRANIVIYNWDLANSVTVNIANAGLQNGDEYGLHNVQDYFKDVITGVYAGQPITIAMTGRTVAKPLGWAAPKTTFPEFGVFVLVKTGQSSTVTPPSGLQLTVESSSTR